MSSGSSCADSAVEPTRSQKSTLAKKPSVGSRLLRDFRALMFCLLEGKRGKTKPIETLLRKSIDRSQYDLPVPKRDTKRLEVGFRDMRKRSKVDVVLDERLHVFAKAELAQPILNRLHRAV
jgi:hypothetical protein